MKKIISAWIEQVIEFDSMTEYQKFINDLKNGKKAYRIITPGCEVEIKFVRTSCDSITTIVSRKAVRSNEIC